MQSWGSGTHLKTTVSKYCLWQHPQTQLKPDRVKKTQNIFKQEKKMPALSRHEMDKGDKQNCGGSLTPRVIVHFSQGKM